ncbi:MAG TPA: invasion associated locus B family protein [Paracoccaceae bacterium]
MFAVTLCLGLGSGAFAQEAPATDAAPAETPATEAPAADAPAAPSGLSMGQEAGTADGPGSVYVAATHGDWEQRCVKTEDGSDPCQLYQMLKDGQGNPVAEISMVALPAGQQASAGATIIAPLETLLTEHLHLQVDAGKGKVYPFTWCAREGCVARVGFTAAEIEAFRKGNKATLTIVPVVAPDQKVALNLSLKGFTAGFDAVKAANGE